MWINWRILRFTVYRIFTRGDFFSLLTSDEWGEHDCSWLELTISENNRIRDAMGILCPWWNTRRWWHGMAWHGIKCGRGIIDIKRRKKEKRNFKLENPNQNLRPETVIRDLKKFWKLRDDLQSSQNRVKHQDTMKKVHQLVIRTKNHDIRYCWNSWISRIHNWYELLAVSLFFIVFWCFTLWWERLDLGLIDRSKIETDYFFALEKLKYWIYRIPL